jgi:hypothetical protein
MEKQRGPGGVQSSAQEGARRSTRGPVSSAVRWGAALPSSSSSPIHSPLFSSLRLSLLFTARRCLLYQTPLSPLQSLSFHPRTPTRVARPLCSRPGPPALRLLPLPSLFHSLSPHPASRVNYHKTSRVFKPAAVSIGRPAVMARFLVPRYAALPNGPVKTTLAPQEPTQLLLASPRVEIATRAATSRTHASGPRQPHCLHRQSSNSSTVTAKAHRRPPPALFSSASVILFDVPPIPFSLPLYLVFSLSLSVSLVETSFAHSYAVAPARSRPFSTRPGLASSYAYIVSLVSLLSSFNPIALSPWCVLLALPHRASPRCPPGCSARSCRRPPCVCCPPLSTRIASSHIIHCVFLAFRPSSSSIPLCLHSILRALPARAA